LTRYSNPTGNRQRETTLDLASEPLRVCPILAHARRRCLFHFREMLLLAGYTILSAAQYGIAVPFQEDFSLAIKVARKNAVPNHARPLQNALSDIGLGTVGYGENLEGLPLDPNEVMLLVGPKF
jgi:hypothetical protein